ncbi:hypothetical protein F558DRAFT_03719 [Streptomyces sp. AmelKG-A3]|nr:hypothetical protein F558DRAFT_03719 [Streptomyces sp. AmelKG-A3]
MTPLNGAHGQGSAESPADLTITGMRLMTVTAVENEQAEPEAQAPPARCRAVNS